MELLVSRWNCFVQLHHFSSIAWSAKSSYRNKKGPGRLLLWALRKVAEVRWSCFDKRMKEKEDRPMAAVTGVCMSPCTPQITSEVTSGL